MKASRLYKAESAGRQIARFQATVPIWQFAPIATEHQPGTLHHKKYLLIVPVPVQSDAAPGFENVQVQVIHREERFLNRVWILTAIGIKHPGVHLPAYLVKHPVSEIHRKQISIMQKAHSPMRTFTDPDAQVLVPAPVDHVELVVIVGP